MESFLNEAPVTSTKPGDFSAHVEPTQPGDYGIHDIPQSINGDAEFIHRLVAHALHPRLAGNLRITETMHTDVATDKLLRLEFSLADDGGAVVLGDTEDLAAAFRKLTRVFGNAMDEFGNAMDEAVKVSKDTRIVQLYKAYARTPEPQCVLDALWGIMTRQEQSDADASRLFAGCKLRSEQPEDE